MCWLVWTSKDLGGRPPLASRCISLSWLFFHGGNTGSNSVGDAKSFSTTSAIFIFENVGLESFDKDFRFEGVAAEEIDGSLDARDCAVVYPKGGRTLATVIISRDLQSLQAEATMEAEIRSQKRDVA